MWSSDLRKRTFLLGLLGLAACGFEPALSPGNDAAALFGRVSIAPAASSSEFALASRLAERLGLAEDPLWRLDYDLTTSRQSASAGDASRTLLTGKVAYRLKSLDPAGPRSSGSVTASVSFTQANTDSTRTAFVISNRAAEKDAEARLTTLLADRLVDALITDASR